MPRSPSQRFLKNKELYAYELNGKIKERFCFSPGDVTAYIVLQRLKGDGYVKASSKFKEGGPIRHYYSITPKGSVELKKAKAIYARYSKHLR
jgi:PadR family transcriptional regulator PadR